jgi:urease accessory protein
MAAMTVGAGLAFMGLRVPGGETVILASVLGFGMMVALARRGQSSGVTAASLAMIAVFAAAHGYAHGVEASGAVGGYLVGFLLATASLHLAGVLLARQVSRLPLAQGLIGAGIAGAGLLMMVG